MIRSISPELKQEILKLIGNRVNDLGNLRELHPELMGLKKNSEEHQSFLEMVDSGADDYTELGLALLSVPERPGEECDGKLIPGMHPEVKRDVMRLCNRLVKNGGTLQKEAADLYKALNSKIPTVTAAGSPSPWLTRHGARKRDLVERGGITQLP